MPGLWKYLSEVWNWLDVAHLLLGVACIATFLLGTRTFDLMLAIAVYLRWFGILYFLQGFTQTGPLACSYDCGYYLRHSLVYAGARHFRLCFDKCLFCTT